MLDQSTEFNMLGCLLTAFASGSFARFNCDVFHFVFYTMSSILFSTRCLPFCFPTSSKTVSLSCSFCFHADSNRATAHGSSERRLYASRDIRSIRIAITVPCQQHQQKSLVGLFRAIAELSRYHDITYLFAVPTPVRLFGLDNSQFLFRAISKLSRYDGIIRSICLGCQRQHSDFWAISLCTI